MNKRILAAILAVGIMTGISLPTYATPNGEVDEARRKYAEMQADVNKIQEKIEELNFVIEPLVIKVEENKKQINDINKQVENTKIEIETTKSEITNSEEVLGDRLREIYKSGGQTSYISLLFSAESFSDLLSKVDITNRLVKTDKKVVKELTDKKDKLDEKVVTLETKAKEVEILNQDTQKRLSEMDVKMKEQETLIAQAKVERDKFDKEFLAEEERQIVAGLIASAKNTNLSISELESTIAQLRQIRDIQIKSPTVKEEINNAIEFAKKQIKQKEKEEAEANRGDGTVPGNVQAVINEAYRHLGKPYVWGATGPNSFDCSGFTSYVYKKATGIYIGRATGNQISSGREVSRSELRPGDLVFTHPGHVGIYLGNNTMIHSPQTGDVVKVSSVYKFWRARRIIE
ncbi:MAG: NlpC/P60 family protein [Clostridium sp.]